MAFHYVSDIPAPPEAFIAHPYTLLQTHRLVGRQPELNLLTDWAAKPQSVVYHARILNIVAIGGMGKSALTWKWFNEIAPQEMKPLVGRMWWSFYESDATFENFVTRALAYTARRSLAEVEQIPAPDREAQLLSALDREPFLIVLDGFERMLIAYARMDAAHLDAPGAPASSRADVVAGGIDSIGAASDHNAFLTPLAREDAGAPGLRRTADPRTGNFLRKLAMVRASRILVSTRLYPADLENKVNGEPLPGCLRGDLRGLAEDDSIDLWRAFGARGERDQLLPIFRIVENHPLLIQSLAGEVARFRRAPGDFGAWRQAHRDFDPFAGGELARVRAHVLEFALRGLADRARKALHVIAAFRMPAGYDTLTALLIGKSKMPCKTERELDVVLVELEDRGLVSWDKRANRYDMHPIVRGVVWGALGTRKQKGIYNTLYNYFESVPYSPFSPVGSVDELASAIELYNTLIRLGRFYEAYDVFSNRLKDATERLGASKLQIELLLPLAEDTKDKLPRLDDAQSLFETLTTLGKAFAKIGQLHRALYILSQAHSLSISSPRLVGPYPWLFAYASRTLLMGGRLVEAHHTVVSALQQSARSPHNEPFYPDCVALLGVIFAARGYKEKATVTLKESRPPDESYNLRFLGEKYMDWAWAQSNLWFKNFDIVLTLFCRNKRNALLNKFLYERHFMWAWRLFGEALLGLQIYPTAYEWLHLTLISARHVNLVEEELPTLIALAELRRQEGKPDEARELLADVWEPAERGPYPLFHADAYNVLAQIERDAGNRDAAIEAATQAYRLAWCDGPPYAYHWGLVAARKHLEELGAPLPDLPPFDPSKYEPMPEVEIDPEDEFHIGAQR
jgi:tetratricopeptide (TPR) repeat protein